MEPVTFCLSGAPQGKGRPRGTARGGFVRFYTPAKTRSYEDQIRSAATDAMNGQPPIDAPVEITLRAVFPVPSSWSKRKQAAAITGEIKPGVKPDLDNILKCFKDAMNGVVYRDDSLIVKGSFAKVYGPAPLVAVTVRAA